MDVGGRAKQEARAERGNEHEKWIIICRNMSHNFWDRVLLLVIASVAAYRIRLYGVG